MRGEVCGAVFRGDNNGYTAHVVAKLRNKKEIIF
jgi:hypothetical protein